MGGSGDGVPLGEDSAIDASAHLGNNSGVKNGVNFRGVVGRRRWRTGDAATRHMLGRTSRSKVVVV